MGFIRRLISNLIAVFKAKLRAEPARYIAYGSAGTLSLSLAISSALGVEIPSSTQLLISGVATIVVTESIRAFVYAPDTVDDIRNAADAKLEAAVTGEVNPDLPEAEG